MIRMFLPEENLADRPELEDVLIINNEILHAESFVDIEFKKGINTWDSCVRTVLSVISGHAQMAQRLSVTDGYAMRVHREVDKINEMLKAIDPMHTAYPNKPSPEEQKAIFEAIKGLKPTQEEQL